jgi:hypothetical protein
MSVERDQDMREPRNVPLEVEAAENAVARADRQVANQHKGKAEDRRRPGGR